VFLAISEIGPFLYQPSIKQDLCYDEFLADFNYVDQGSYSFHSLTYKPDTAELVVGGGFQGSIGGLPNYWYLPAEDHYGIQATNDNATRALRFGTPAFYTVDRGEFVNDCGLTGACFYKQQTRKRDEPPFIERGYCQTWGHPDPLTLPAGADVDLLSGNLDYELVTYDYRQRAFIGIPRGSSDLERFAFSNASVTGFFALGSPPGAWLHMGSHTPADGIGPGEQANSFDGKFYICCILLVVG
jgi:hypothetical protein